jgi:CrcB protein
MVDPAQLVGLGGALGAVLRYTLGLALDHERLPLATFAVNVLGSLLLGLVVFLGAGDGLTFFLGVGLCGSFTTYSSFSVETVRLWEDGDRFRASAYAAGTLLTCTGAVGAAWLVAQLF